jgi:PAS domain S-box-containing protein
LSILAALTLLVTVSAQAQLDNTVSASRVLILHGVWKNDYWEHEFDRVFADTIQVIAGQEIHVSSQYLGLNRPLSGQTRQRLLDNIDAIIREQDVDLIVGVQPDAVNFLYELPISSEVPSLLVLPDESTLPNDPAVRQSVVLSAWRPAMAGTLAMIDTLLPDIDTVEVVVGNSDGDLVYLERFREIGPAYAQRWQFNYHVGVDRQVIAAQSAELPSTSAVLTLPFNASGPERRPVRSNSLRALAQMSAVPVFGLYDSQFEYGITGGHMTSVTDYANSAARQALGLLEGGAPQNISGDASGYLSWAAIERFNLPVNRLDGSFTLVGEPPSLWSDYPFLSALGINLILLLGLGLVVMAWMYRRSLSAQARIAASEQLARDSEARYRLLADNVADIIWVVEEGANYVKYCSPSVQLITGYTPEECQTTPVSELMHREDFAALNRAMLTDRSATITREVRLKRKSGDWAWTEIVIQPTRTLPDGRQEWTGITRDISRRKQGEAERKRLEEQVRQAQKFESLGTLAGGIAHDFNNILTVIMGIADMLRLEFRNHPDSLRLLNRQMAAAEKARNLVQQILTFSRQSTGKRSETDARSLVQESIRLVEAGKPDRIKLSAALPEAEQAAIRVDAIQLQQALINVLTNALEALPAQQGQVAIDVFSCELQEPHTATHGQLEPGRYVCIKITDSGKGISEQAISKVFDPFFTSKQLGSGMGLAIVHGIIMDHDGAIDLQSRVNHGTSLQIWLPRTDTPNAATGPRQADNKSATHGQRILVVDDQEELLDVVSAMLQQLGHECISCSDPREAMTIISQQADSLGLLITDYSMPGMSGLELLEFCRSNCPTLPVVISTGYGENSSGFPAQQARDVDLLEKPYNLDKLQNAIERALEKQHC